ncbi:MAG TPA: DUF1778 domain-containing protein [Kofleriaceae bacterium]|jgi:uncharacterized protein (DUF1778 family)
MAPKKRKKDRKALSIQIRVTAEQKKSLNEAAKTAGAGLSTWLLITGLAAAAELKARETKA